MGDDLDALMRTVMAEPNDPLPKLVLADWLDEPERLSEERRPELAYALRWCAAHGRCPYREEGHDEGGTPVTEFVWLDSRYDYPDSPEHCLLPGVLWLKADGERRGYDSQPDRSHETPLVAFATLAAALADLRAVVNLPTGD